MRWSPVVIALVCVVVLGVALPGSHPAAAQDGTPTAMAGHPLVGAWVLDNDVDDPVNPPELIVFAADGSYIGAAVDGTNTIGAWEATGTHSAAVTLVFFVPGEDGASGATVTVRGTVDVAADGQSFTAPYTLEVTDPEGARSGEFGPSTATGTRITVEPMGTPVAPISALFAPLAGTPTP
jgi:hypothetical protein